MQYRIYAYSYEYNWELYSIVNKKKEVYNVIKNIDPSEYKEYMVIKRTDRDEIYDSGKIAERKVKKLKKGR